MVRTYSRWRICATLAFCCAVFLGQAAWSKEKKKDPGQSAGTDPPELRGSAGTTPTVSNDASSEPRFGIYVLDTDGQPSKKQWSMRVFKGPCNKRREFVTEFQIKGVTYISLAQAAGSAAELCAAMVPDKSDASQAKCFPLPIKVPFWTPQINREATCPPRGENIPVTFEIKGSPGRVSLEELKKAVEGLTVTIRGGAVSGPTAFLDLSEDAAPITRTEVQINPPKAYYTVSSVYTDSSSKQVNIVLDQQFVSLRNLKIAPRTSTGALAKDCVLTLFVEPETRLHQDDWDAALRSKEIAENGEIKIFFADRQYTLPQQLLEGRDLQLFWPPEAPSPVKIRTDKDNADCNMRDAATVDRIAFFGGAFTPVVRQSRPGLAFIATRLDRLDLEKLGLEFDTEILFWTSLFSMVDTVDHGENDRSSTLEWARISQYQSGPDSDREFETLMPPARGARLFGAPSERQGKINTFVSRLTATQPVKAQKFAPFDALYQLNDTITKMAVDSGGGAGQSISNVRVLVAGPRFGDQPICGKLRQEATYLADSLAPKTRKIRIAFVELTPTENPKGLVSTGVRGLSQCDLSGSKLAGVVASYVVYANYLSSEQTRKQVFDELGKLIARDFSLGG